MENIKTNSIQGKLLCGLTCHIGMSKIIDSGSISENNYYIAMEALGSSLKDLAQK